MAEESKELKEIKARLDVLEAAGEAAGYLVWDKKRGRFCTPGDAPAEPATAAPKGAGSSPSTD